MNNFELEHCLKTNKITRKNFRGVFPANQLSNLKTIRNGLYIANTSPEHIKGLHWVAFYKDSKCVQVFDTSGMLAQKNKYFKQFLSKCNRKYIINNKMIQNPKSNICGQYCLVFGLYAVKGKSLCDFLKMFSESNLIENDKLILRLFYKNFKKPVCQQYNQNLYLCI